MEKLSILLLGNEDRDIFTRLFEEGKFESHMMVAEDTANRKNVLMHNGYCLMLLS